MRRRASATTLEAMTTPTYAAIWHDNGGQLAGSAKLGSRSLDLAGSAGGREARRRIAYGDIASLRMARNGNGLAGRPAVVIETRYIGDVRIAMTQPGALHEFMESLMRLTSEKGAER